MGDTRQVVGFYPTELIIPTFRKRFMDGVLKLDDGSLMNIEFETGNLTEKFLLRCAQYAINLRIISGKYVETNIFSTGTRVKSRTMTFISKFFLFKPKLFFYSELDGLEKLIYIIVFLIKFIPFGMLILKYFFNVGKNTNLALSGFFYILSMCIYY